MVFFESIFTMDDLILKYPNSPDCKFAIKYQDKFKLTLENLKCLNPDCNNMRKWSGSSNTGFSYCCSKNCKNICQNEIKTLMINKRKNTGFDSDRANSRRRETCLRKYGVDHPSKISETRTKAKQTYFERTGFNHNMYNPETKEKIKKTMLIKYGYEFNLQNQTTQQLIKSSNFDKYGTISPNQGKILNLDKLNDRNFWQTTFVKDNFFDYKLAMVFFNLTLPKIHEYAKKLKLQFIKYNTTSRAERAITKYLESLDLIVIQNDRNVLKPMELDIWLPELGLGIEYNGLYWHSYHDMIGTSPKQVDLEYMKYRHQKKSLASIEKGIRLLHLYDDQTWPEQIEIIENFLLYDPENDNNNNNWDLDAGCYPLGMEFGILEPENRIVLDNRIIYNAGRILKIGLA